MLLEKAINFGCAAAVVLIAGAVSKNVRNVSFGWIYMIRVLKD